MIESELVEEKLPSIKKYNRLKWITVGIFMVPIFVISAIIIEYSNIWFGSAFFLTTSLLFLKNSLFYAPIKPPLRPIPVVFGKYVNQLQPSGWILNPPGKSRLWLDFDLMDARELVLSFDVVQVLPDRTEITVPVTIYYLADPCNPVQIVNDGGLEQVAPRLQGQTVRAMERWYLSTEKGPQSMDQARLMNDEAINELLERLAGDDIKRIPSEIPSEVLIGFLFKARPLSPKEKEWKEKFESLTADKQNAIRTAAKERFDDIEKLRNGKKVFALHSLGVVVKKLVVGNVEPSEATKLATDRVAETRFENESQTLKAQNVQEEVEKLMAKGIPAPEAMRQALIRRGIIKENVTVNRTEIAPEIINALNTILPEALDRIFGKRIVLK